MSASSAEVARLVIRVAVVGCGAISKLHHIPNLKTIPSAELVALCDENPKTLEEVGNRFGVNKLYTSHEDLLDREQVDAVVVATPTPTHCQVVTYAASRGVHIFCEKPLCTSMKEAEEMRKALSQSKVVFMMGFNMRFSPNIRRVEQLVRGGFVGEILSMHIGFNVPGPEKWPAETDFYFRRESGGGALFDSGSHALDICQWLAGDVDTIYASILSEEQKYDVAASISLETRKNAVASINVSWRASWPMVRVEVFGTKGLVETHLRERLLEKPLYVTIHRKRGLVFREGVVRIPIRETKTPYYEELIHFISCVKKQKTPSPSFVDGVKNLCAILSAYDSASAGEAKKVVYPAWIAEDR